MPTKQVLLVCVLRHSVMFKCLIPFSFVTWSEKSVTKERNSFWTK